MVRFFLFAAFLLLLPLGAEARTCGLPKPQSGLSPDIPPRNFFLCLLAEIEDLKREQAKLKKKIAEYEDLRAELPGPYVNDNGKVTVEEGRKIGTATFILTARQTGGGSSLPIDQQVLEELCAAGCEISLVLREIAIFDSSPVSSTISGPCAFDYTPASGKWIRGESCSGGSLTGTDGGGAFGTGGGGEIVTDAGGACIFADAEVRRTVGTDTEPFDRDHARGMFLIALPDRRTEGRSRFRCDLIIE